MGCGIRESQLRSTLLHRTMAWVAAWMPVWLFTSISFVNITIPSLVFSILSYTFTVNLNFTSILCILLALGLAIFVLIRYKYLTKYSRLPPEPPRKESELELFPEVPEEDMKPGFHNYMDEFLSAIKIFGYLERPVFHELTRQMHTRKLAAGETISLEEEEGFITVVDGCVQVFVQNTQNQEDGCMEDRYQMLNEAKNGAALSSFFTILSLFTDDVALATPALELKFTLDKIDEDDNAEKAVPDDPVQPRSVHRDIIARATTDTTIAIIPTIAFQRLTKTYPKASAHIVQVILARFQRVTFSTAHSYLGLTKEILSAEKILNETAKFELPNSVQFERSKQRFLKKLESSTSPNAVKTSSMYKRVFSKNAHDMKSIADVETIEAEDNLFREKILDCLFLTVGLVSPTESPSIPVSPRLISQDYKTNKFNNAFVAVLGQLDDTSSVVSTSSVHSTSSEIDSDIDILYYKRGEILIKSGEAYSGMFYLIDGTLEMLLDETPLFQVSPGGVAGYLAAMAGARSFIDVTAKTDVLVGFFSKTQLEKLIDRNPVLLLTMAKRFISLLSTLILQVDIALDWISVPSGQIIHHQGDDADAIYIVLNGRVRSLLEDENKKIKITGEYGQGESLGELEVLTETKRPNSLHAIRTTELVKVPKMLFQTLALQHPGITLQISKILANRMGKFIDHQDTPKSNVNLRTIGIIPASTEAPIIEFANRLGKAFDSIGSGVIILHHAHIMNHLGRHAFSRMGKLKLAGYLTDLEERYAMVLYVSDTTVGSHWTQTCIAQADAIMLVADAEADPTIEEHERFLLGMKTTARKELVLIHPEKFVPPGLTRQWLKSRSWISAHFHVQMTRGNVRSPTDSTMHHRPLPTRAFTNLKNKVKIVKSEISKMAGRPVSHAPIYRDTQDYKNDFVRLARRLCGKSVGLVLSGGGARGIAELGAIRAIEEMGIPIDIIGGTSIGAFIGGLYARDTDHVPLYGRVKKFAGRMASMWRMYLDFTYPLVSYTTGHEFNRGVWKTFGDAHIEDFWLPFFCNTTNITQCKMEVHTSGYAWRYVRASMSLAGLVPPLCDEGRMLLDGGYIDNLVVSTMKSMGADIVLAVNIGSVDDDTPMTYGDSLSGVWAVFNRWNPFSSHPNVPTLTEIQGRLAYVASVPALEAAKNTPGCIYMRPPVQDYATLQFAKFDEIYEVGYKYAKEFLETAWQQGKLDGLVTKERLGMATMERRNSSTPTPTNPTSMTKLTFQQIMEMGQSASLKSQAAASEIEQRRRDELAQLRKADMERIEIERRERAEKIKREREDYLREKKKKEEEKVRRDNFDNNKKKLVKTVDKKEQQYACAKLN
ncbi:Lysophospholipase NTE1 [Neolecta irregularis DAH-3]|uniref:Lysophospholipase NTE1 n=1 Tax=Neolecta irregularis (strain DAH-3) TaxID=1198029 RepID=A0A1U7LLC1_NEOID|nr:Lysophospholipase NTE1 [Neolecta irregularis DAH-3]|eukprot:OLL23455.1 Lysophospholipase NTE1 [Neolecta irregularis DAH-3]